MYECKYAQNVYRKVVAFRVWVHNSPIVSRIHAGLTNTIHLSDSRAIVRKVKSLYSTFSYEVLRVITHKMAYRKATATHVLGHNWSILTRMQL